MSDSAASAGGALSLELGQGRKEPLRLESPLLAASGAAGSGPLLRELCLSRELGALILPPLAQAPAGTATPRGAQAVTGGCLLSSTGAVRQRRLTGLVRSCRGRGDLPLVAAIAPGDIRQCEALCQDVLDLGLESVELHVTPDTASGDLAEMTALLASVPLRACLVRLPLANAIPLAEAAASAGADALVVAAPLAGCVRRASGELVTGLIHAPALLPAYAQTIRAVSQVGVPVVGRGGIVTWDDVLTMLASGASAVELDSILWAEPAALQAIYERMVTAVQEAGVTRWGEYLERISL